MTCDNYRELISSRLDGELASDAQETLDTHLRACESCAEWAAQATELNRRVRVSQAADVPDYTEFVLAESARRPRPSWIRRQLTPGLGAGITRLRIALAVAGIAQIALGIAQVLGVDIVATFGLAGAHAAVPEHGHTHGAQPVSPALAEHVFSESAAWNLAIGIALLWIALRPRLASGMLPAMTSFVGVLGVLVIRDLYNGIASVGHVIPHIVLVPGLVLLYLMHRRITSGGFQPTPMRQDSEADIDGANALELNPSVPADQRRPRHLRPAGRAA